MTTGGAPKKPRFSEQQIAMALRQAEQGTPAVEVCRKLGVSEATFYAWKKRYVGMGVAELRRVRQLEDENRRLKQVVADLTLDKQMLQEVLQKKGLRPARRRGIARDLFAAYRVSVRRACGLVGCHRATFYYRAKRRDPAPLRMRLRELAAARPRFGYRRLYILLRREGWRVNHKRIYRLYGEEQLAVRTRRRKKRASHLRVVPPRPTRPNEQWCMDFMADRLEDGRRIRILTVEDVFTRECLAVEMDLSLTSARVVSVLERIVRERAAPAVITVDNGSEFYARLTDSWAYREGVRLEFSRPGKPMDNPFIESFNGRRRDEHLNVELFFSIVDAQQKILEWQQEHSSLGNVPPREFAAQWQSNQAAGGAILNLETV